MNGRKEIIYFDACIFIAWLKKETRIDPNDMKGVQQVIDRVKKRDIVIITSTITQVEVAACKVGSGALGIFDDLLKRKNLQRHSLDIKTSKIAREIRDFYESKKFKSSSKTFTTADAVHIATAVLYKADSFYTFDKELLDHSGDVAGHNLIIEKPPSELTLF